nr:NfeD family protein [Kineosporia babensis]
MLAGGALAAAGADALGAGLPIQVLAFAIASAVLIGAVRPPLKAWMLSGKDTVTGTAALVGADALVLDPVSEHSGLVKLAGETWTARILPGGVRLELDSTVHVVRIEGATAIVAATSEIPQIPELAEIPELADESETPRHPERPAGELPEGPEGRL